MADITAWPYGEMDHGIGNRNNPNAVHIVIGRKR